mmetsp:Transcript_113194/g.330833  ORF Transcript_113194/g.330833 Transcript_113194/m.330833 type:complete len:228 (-) Transcript_113194:142-825(-)
MRLFSHLRAELRPTLATADLQLCPPLQCRPEWILVYAEAVGTKEGSYRDTVQRCKLISKEQPRSLKPRLLTQHVQESVRVPLEAEAACDVEEPEDLVNISLVHMLLQEGSAGTEKAIHLVLVRSAIHVERVVQCKPWVQVVDVSQHAMQCTWLHIGDRNVSVPLWVVPVCSLLVRQHLPGGSGRRGQRRRPAPTRNRHCLRVPVRCEEHRMEDTTGKGQRSPGAEEL